MKTRPPRVLGIASGALRVVARAIGLDLQDARTLIRVGIRAGVLIFYGAAAGLTVRAFIWGTGLSGLFGGG